MVGGRWVIHDHRHAQAATIASAFKATMTELTRAG
jgi:hypothetical protein